MGQFNEAVVMMFMEHIFSEPKDKDVPVSMHHAMKAFRGRDLGTTWR
jgi:hypothetical protein